MGAVFDLDPAAEAVCVCPRVCEDDRFTPLSTS